MAFTEDEIAEYALTIEQHFWSHHRPPLHLRDKICEGQRFSGQAIELFFVRPAFDMPGKFIEEPIAKVKFVRSRKVWQLFWKRADNKWHRYPPNPEEKSLAEALDAINANPNGCFFG